MRASIQKVSEILGSDRAPKRITQEPFDYDPGHYRRLCDLDGQSPDAVDLVDYALDMTYMELQPDLLRHLLPVLLTAWRRDLFEGSSTGFGGFSEHFWPALLRGKALHETLATPECRAVENFMRDSILDRLDQEQELSFPGMAASPYDWIQALVSYGVVFASIESIWKEWWRFETTGQSVAAFQYVSALAYEDSCNPVFAPWTRDKGGGAPALWECGCHLFDVGWKEENLRFLCTTLSVDYIGDRLSVALERITDPAPRKVATQIFEDLPKNQALLALRIEELPRLLTDVSAVSGFTI